MNCINPTRHTFHHTVTEETSVWPFTFVLICRARSTAVAWSLRVARGLHTGQHGPSRPPAAPRYALGIRVISCLVPGSLHPPLPCRRARRPPLPWYTSALYSPGLRAEPTAAGPLRFRTLCPESKRAHISLLSRAGGASREGGASVRLGVLLPRWPHQLRPPGMSVRGFQSIGGSRGAGVGPEWGQCPDCAQRTGTHSAGSSARLFVLGAGSRDQVQGSGDGLPRGRFQSCCHIFSSGSASTQPPGLGVSTAAWLLETRLWADWRGPCSGSCQDSVSPGGWSNTRDTCYIPHTHTPPIVPPKTGHGQGLPGSLWAWWAELRPRAARSTCWMARPKPSIISRRDRWGGSGVRLASADLGTPGLGA